MEVSASVKKQPGKLALDGNELIWRPNSGSATAIDLVKVTGMKATPPTAATARILLLGPENATLLKVDFAARDILDRARDTIQNAIQAVRAAQEAAAVAPPAPETSAGAVGDGTPKSETPETEAGAKPVVAKKPKVKKAAASLDPAKLLTNIELQRQVLKSDDELRITFQNTVISGSLSNEQFWSMRLDTLMTAAQTAAQARGAYNVLSTIRPTTGSDNKINLSLTRDKIIDIFDQYPIVRKAYNDNVPKLSEGEFWQRFFMSRLYLTLRGEKISNNHPIDGVIDKYIGILEESRKRRKTSTEAYVPLFLDVEGNEEDVPGVRGNGPDITMKLGVASDSSGLSLIRSMNGLSQRLLRGRGPSGAAPAKTPSTARQDHDLEEQITLRDLEPEVHKGHELDLRMAAAHITAGALTDSADPAELARLRSSLEGQLEDQIDLSIVTEMDSQVLDAARQQVTELLEQQASESQTVTERLVNMDQIHIVHATTQEFLRHFWAARTHDKPVEPLLDGLRNSLLRVDAAVNDAGPHAEKARAALSTVVESVKRALKAAEQQVGAFV